jgi:hypothetical protein
MGPDWIEMKKLSRLNLDVWHSMRLGEVTRKNCTEDKEEG